MSKQILYKKIGIKKYYIKSRLWINFRIIINFAVPKITVIPFLYYKAGKLALYMKQYIIQMTSLRYLFVHLSSLTGQYPIYNLTKIALQVLQSSWFLHKTTIFQCQCSIDIAKTRDGRENSLAIKPY